MNIFLTELSNDCTILLERALLGKSIACFGIDGFGKYGQSDQAKSYVVASVDVELQDDGDRDIPQGNVLITLQGYDATQFGHVCTDQNFKLSMNALLKEQEIRADCWDWETVSKQEQDTVNLVIHVEKLLEWF